MRSSLSSKRDLPKINLNLMHLKILMRSSRVYDSIYNNYIRPMVGSTTAVVSVAKFRKKINFNVQVFA